jgi:hypothetical protein
MSQILLTGWRPGFQKVSLTKLLQTSAGLTLGAAKSVTDEVLNGKSVVVSLTKGDANEFVDAADKLGAVASILSITRTGTHG